VFGVQALAAWLPITPSGLGISEAVMIPALIAFGSPRSAAVLGILTWRVLAYWLPIPLGALAFGSLRVFNRSAAKPATSADSPPRPGARPAPGSGGDTAPLRYPSAGMASPGEPALQIAATNSVNAATITKGRAA
jgi:hypothetical protein